MVMVPLISKVIEGLHLPSLDNLLAIAAVGLLVFVTVTIGYLSFVDWKDKRRISSHGK